MTESDFPRFLATIHPYDSFDRDEIARTATLFRSVDFKAGALVYEIDMPLEGLYLIESGQVTVFDEEGEQLSSLGCGNSFGERGLLRDGKAVTTARAAEDTRLWVLPSQMRFTICTRRNPPSSDFSAEVCGGLRLPGPVI
jgi:CBS domain-containing protein